MGEGEESEAGTEESMSAYVEPIEDVDPIDEELRQIDRRERTAWRRHYNCTGDNVCAVCDGELIPTDEEERR